MVAHLTAGRVLVASGDATAAEPHITRGLELAESLGTRRFKPFQLIYIVRIRHARGALANESVDSMHQALDLANQTGAGFLAAWVLGTLALVSDDATEALEALRDGKELLAKGCVGHNYCAFYRSAIEVALQFEEWCEADRYADALTAYAATEPALVRISQHAWSCPGRLWPRRTRRRDCARTNALTRSREAGRT